MRAVALLAALAVVSLSLPADAATRRKHRPYPVITVKPRSFLDAGKEVPVGSLSHYAYDMLPSGGGIGQLYPGRIKGDQPLPQRNGFQGFPIDIPAPAFLRK